MTEEQLAAIMPLAHSNVDVYIDALNRAMNEFEISTTNRQAAFLANVAHESAELSRALENLNYSANGLLLVFGRYFDKESANAYARQPERIANHVYANRNGNGDEASGDGWKYRGRGLIQITGRDNYRACGDALGMDLVAIPELLADPAHASDSAAWFFRSNGCNELADADDFQGVCGIINCGRKDAPLSRILGYDERVKYWLAAKRVLA